MSHKNNSKHGVGLTFFGLALKCCFEPAAWLWKSQCNTYGSKSPSKVFRLMCRPMKGGLKVIMMKEQTKVRIGWVLFDAKEFDVSTPLSLGNGRRVKFPKIEIRIFQKIENSTFRPPLLSLYCIEVETLLFKNVFFCRTC